MSPWVEERDDKAVKKEDDQTEYEVPRSHIPVRSLLLMNVARGSMGLHPDNK